MVVTARRWTRIWLLVSSVLVGLVVLVLVLGSPLALSVLDETGDHDWRRLSEIGQTYGAVSVLLSAMTLGGIAVSLVLQSRSARLDLEQGPHVIHMDLLKMALEDPDLMACWGGVETDKARMPNRRQYLYMNMIVSFWEMTLEVGNKREAQLKVAADGLFSGPLGRAFWQENRLVREADTKPKRQLHHLLDERLEVAMRREMNKLAVPAESEAAGHEAETDGVQPRSPDSDVEEAPT